ncbi:hypothetical protein [Gilvimarinus sp. DA14]|uniref:hypothetical protein n=1 Tax=Gilvimarinus sp. DA14 TaxID=2956798 RepID=UPI0020B6F021|nr:hypothetical protein [Gilvimarinus sp. DA14]UTF60802.1 hypothetical protein NHM04_03095 [Gilvimarinus sp. DA14]
MSLVVVEPEKLAGQAGINALKQLQHDMAKALACSDFNRLSQLDATCSRLLDKVTRDNQDDKTLLLQVLLDVKTVYATLIGECARIASSKAN